MATARGPRRRGVLFDGHCEARNEMRDFFEMPGILRLYGAREPREAFVIGHVGNIDRYDRGR